MLCDLLSNLCVLPTDVPISLCVQTINMAFAYLADHSLLGKLFFVFEVVGETFLSVTQFSRVVRYFVIDGVKEGKDCEKGFNDREERRFVSEAKSVAYLHPGVTKCFREKFREFHDFSVGCGVPIARIFVSEKKVCNVCSNYLVVEGKPHVVVVYDIALGSYLGSRITKVCRKCKLYQHYGYWTQKGERCFDRDCLTLDFFMSSEETVFDIALIQECMSLLVVGAVPFSTFAASYNRRFGYRKLKDVGSHEGNVKRMKRCV